MSNPVALVWSKSQALALIFRLILGGVFLYAGIAKTMDPAGFAQAIYNYRILPGSLVNPVAILLPWVELIVGFGLLLGVWVTGAALLASGLLTAFAVALVLNLVRGLDIDCGCFGSAGTGTGNTLWYLLRDLALLAMGVHAIIFDCGVASLGSLIWTRRKGGRSAQA